MKQSVLLGNSYLFKQLVLEEYTSLNKLISETTTKVSWPGNSKAAESFIKTLSSVTVESTDLNGHNIYRIAVKETGGAYGTDTDKIRLSSDGDAYIDKAMRDFRWKYVGNSLEIWNDETKQKQGTITKGSNKLDKWTSSKQVKTNQEDEAEVDADDETTWSDYGHIGLDILGIVDAYGIGPAADLINAAWYFYEGENFEAILSVIGAIPIIGSAIAIPIKLVIKSRHLIKLNKLIKSGNSIKIWEYLLQNKIIDIKLLTKLAKGLDSLEHIMPGAKKFVTDKLPKSVSTQVNKALSKLEEWLKINSKTIDELLESSKATGAKKPFIGITTPTIFKDVSLVKKILYGVSGVNIIRGLAKQAWWPTSHLVKVERAIMTKFIKIYSKDPTKLASLLVLTPNSARLFRTLDDIIYNKISSLPKDIQKIIPNSTKSNRELVLLLNKLQRSTTKGAQELYSILSGKIVNYAIENDSLAWSAFKSDIAMNFKAMFTESGVARDIDIISQRFTRYLPVIWNEIEGVLDNLGFDKENDPNAVVWPLIYWAIGLGNDGNPDEALKSIKNSEIIKTLRTATSVVKSQAITADEEDYSPSKYRIDNGTK